MKSFDYCQRLLKAHDYVMSKISGNPDIGIVLGTCLGSFDQELENPIIIPYEDIPQMLKPTVDGHRGCLIYGKIGDRNILCLSGRSHQYEGYFPHEVQFAVRLIALCGVKLMILTNCAGTSDPDIYPGDIAPIEDVINFTQRGYTEEPLLHTIDYDHLIPINLFDKDYCEFFCETAKELNMNSHKCTYVYNFGPAFETHAEVKGEHFLGATNYGMSTVPEIIALKELNVPVLGLSFVSNKAAGIGGIVLDAQDITDCAFNAQPKNRNLISNFIKKVPLKEKTVKNIKLQGDDFNISLPQPKEFINVKGNEIFKNLNPQVFIIPSCCHSIEYDSIVLSVILNELPNFPLYKINDSALLNFGTIRNCKLVVCSISGLNDLCGLNEYQLWYLISLLKDIGVSTYIQTFTCANLTSKKNSISVIKDAIPLFERPIIPPRVNNQFVNHELENGSIVASYHGPEFPTKAEILALKKLKATDLTLGTIKGLFIASGLELNVVGISDESYNYDDLEKIPLNDILQRSRKNSHEINELIQQNINKYSQVSHQGVNNPEFILNNKIKSLTWNQIPSSVQNQQENPKIVNLIKENLPHGIKYAFLFEKNEIESLSILSPQFLSFQQLKLSLEEDECFIGTYQTNTNKILLTFASRVIVRALASMNIPIIGISKVLITNPQYQNEKYISISDHFNESGIFPLVGKNNFGERFPDVSYLYTDVPGLKKAVSFYTPHLSLITKAYSEAIHLIGIDVASKFGPLESLIYRHSCGKVFYHIGVCVQSDQEKLHFPKEIIDQILNQ
ncbi:inosine guanosine and xanthosine phosphorylase family protein [Tritrichomonas foetus]|uniref:purine-nucleoside phosphorylase n=1 Tax=Tritrichomonas foetus TaxID=1144522 RepID=A0A1J4KQW7_9EUKA|nr:inosine guanosine and xanthosine phosphorylase family protein [Tritrichomonas foetus]|eukprot:OHT13651.1 inosine guanosine and xanthosine phosphorylase family protein [Tritrichomonas foetus]